MARDPSNPSRLYLGTGEDGVSFPVGDGLYASPDGGQSWQVANPPPILNRSWYGTQVGGLTVDKAAGTHVLAATTHALFGSRDGGLNWQPLAFGHFTNVAQDPSSPARFWATSVSGAGGGTCAVSVYESTDGGSTFSSQLSVSLSTGPFDAGAGLGLGAEGSGYLAISDCQGYLHEIRRHDGTAPGGVWNPITKPGEAIDSLFYAAPSPKASSFPGQGSFDNVVAVDPTNPCDVLFGGVNLWMTTDGCDKKQDVNFINLTGTGSGACNCQTTGKLHDDIHAIAFEGTGAALVGSDGGIYDVRSLTSGPTVRNLNTPSLDIAQFYSGTAADSTHLMGGTQDNATPANFGGGWQPCGLGDGGQSDFSGSPGLIHYEQDESLYATNGCGQSAQSIGACAPKPFMQFTFPPPCGNNNGVKDPAQFPNPPYAVGISGQLYEATSRVWESGSPPSPGSWTDTTGNHPLVRSGLSGYHCGSFCPDYISSMSAETDVGQFFTASAYGAVWANGSIDNGGTWSEVTANLPAPSPATKPDGIPWITHIAISPATNLAPAFGAWATIGGAVTGAGYVWRYDGTAKRWTDMSSGLPHYPALTDSDALAVWLPPDG